MWRSSPFGWSIERKQNFQLGWGNTLSCMGTNCCWTFWSPQDYKSGSSLFQNKSNILPGIFSIIELRCFHNNKLGICRHNQVRLVSWDWERVWYFGMTSQLHKRTPFEYFKIEYLLRPQCLSSLQRFWLVLGSIKSLIQLLLLMNSSQSSPQAYTIVQQ